MGSSCIKKHIHAQQVEAVACRTLKIIFMFTVVVLVHVTKYIYGQHLYKEADACIVKWKLWRVGL